MSEHPITIDCVWRNWLGGTIDGLPFAVKVCDANSSYGTYTQRMANRRLPPMSAAGQSTRPARMKPAWTRCLPTAPASPMQRIGRQSGITQPCVRKCNKQASDIKKSKKSTTGELEMWGKASGKT